MPVLDVIAVHKSFGRGERLVSAVRGVSLSLEAGEFVATIGPSGCGKSTLLHVCGAMEQPTRGTVRIDGKSLASLNDDELTRLRRNQIGFVFQFFNLLPTLTVIQNVALPLILDGDAEDKVIRQAGVLVARVGLSSRSEHFPEQLSGGEAQRVAIARAVIHRPVLLIADEPTGNLDSRNGSRVLELLLDLNRQFGTAVLLATHDRRVASAAGRVLQMRDGTVIDNRTAKRAEKRPRGSAT